MDVTFHVTRNPSPFPHAHIHVTPAVDIDGYIPPYEDPETTVPLDPNYLGYLYFDGHEETEAGEEAGAPPNYTEPIPAPDGVLPAAETNMIDARPLDHMLAPDATHNMYLEIVFAADDTGVNRAYVNGITSPHEMDMPVPDLYPYLDGNVS